MNGRKARELRRQAVNRREYQVLKWEAHRDQGQRPKFEAERRRRIPARQRPIVAGNEGPAQAVAPADRHPAAEASQRPPSARSGRGVPVQHAAEVRGGLGGAGWVEFAMNGWRCEDAPPAPL